MPNQYPNFDKLLYDNRWKKEGPFTHTRIGDKHKGGDIYGGTWNIPDDLMPQFWKLYHKKVFKKGNKEYLTEVQDKENGGPILIDLDMRFDKTIQTRVFGLSHISDIIELYGEALSKLFNFTTEVTIPIYVFHREKRELVSMKDGKTKDGLHLIIGLHMKHIYQEILRDIVINIETNEMQIFGEDNLNCTNPVNEIFDECIPSGKNNWQVWGSQKPDADPYKLKQEWSLTIQEQEGEADVQYEKMNVYEDSDLSTDEIKRLLPIISAKNKNFVKHPEIRELYRNKFEELSEEKKKKKKKKRVAKKNQIILTNTSLALVDINLKIPKNSKELDDHIDKIHKEIDIKDYYLKELHDLVMILDERYYNPFQKWLEVGWALHNTSKFLFWTWIKFSSKSDKFVWSDIQNLMMKWNNEMQPGLSWRSIHYWCRTDFPAQFEEIHTRTAEQAAYATLITKGADTDIAILAKYMFMGQYSCTSMQYNRWYKFSDHRWKENDCGISLRSSLSTKINKLFSILAHREKEIYAHPKDDEPLTMEEKEKHIEACNMFITIARNLKTASKKNNIMKECQEQFYDHGQMAKKMDQNPMLLGFENGIYDFTKKIFRAGEPEDYVSFSTRTNYVPYDKKDPKQKAIKDEIDDFMLKVFPNTLLRKYMWEHAASALIGVQRNQKFNIYTGCGSNGKSMFVNLMNLTLGDYSDKLNIALVTQKRKSIGGPTPEIAKLKGKRYVSMDEPSVGDRLNEGIMKQMVGGDEMEGREMYGRHMIKFYPQFELVCCTNRLFEINSNDKGTWRRIRQVDFRSEFLDPPDYQKRKAQNLCNDAENPIYLKDDTIESKFSDWVQVFTSLLIELVNKTEGKVVDCPQVTEASERYQEKQDFYALFCKEKIRKGTSEDKIKKTDIRSQFQSWYQENYQAKPPKSMDLYDQLDKRLGKYRKRGWWGYKIIYDPTESEDEDDESTD